MALIKSRLQLYRKEDRYCLWDSFLFSKFGGNMWDVGITLKA